MDIYMLPHSTRMMGPWARQRAAHRWEL